MSNLPKLEISSQKTSTRTTVEYEQLAENSINILGEAYREAPGLIRIQILGSRQDFLDVIGKESAPDWLVAYVPQNSASTIVLLDNEQNPLSSLMLSKILTHEIAHLYTNILNRELPDWVKEGISMQLAQQVKIRTVTASNWDRISPQGEPFSGITWQAAAEVNGYEIAGLILCFLFERYGMKNIFDSLKGYTDGSVFLHLQQRGLDDASAIIDKMKSSLIEN